MTSFCKRQIYSFKREYDAEKRTEGGNPLLDLLVSCLTLTEMLHSPFTWELPHSTHKTTTEQLTWPKLHAEDQGFHLTSPFSLHRYHREKENVLLQESQGRTVPRNQ